MLGFVVQINKNKIVQVIFGNEDQKVYPVEEMNVSLRFHCFEHLMGCMDSFPHGDRKASQVLAVFQCASGQRQEEVVGRGT